ncbi:diacylglycerol kinase (ATP dependent) [Jeotgalibacillus alimentarius]|uniref:Diacylglycerol kinase (ATP dependent) n=1 Tax=Jeotgalibacillus alimentarius TaxID=135826 RepID=A0A0C2VX52_9BACL|nr:diacylglycerol kinase family protein [Jeotgalibacillus alimentarius]KIL53437.1 diacylglycerol kinase (ATP dependent) [Jeotgalibacillus alimentarius]
MMNPKKFALSFKYAAHGLRDVFYREQNFKIHTFAGIAVIAAGLFFQISNLEWLVIIITIGSVLALELMNTAVERTVDLISPEQHPLAKQAKDAGAASVFIFSCAAAIAGGIIFIPKILSLM